MIIGEWLSSFMVSVVWTKFTHIPFIGEGSSTYKRGWITHNGWVNCPYCKIHPCCKFVHITIHPCGWANFNSPLRVCYPNVGKYHVNTCKYVCKHTKKHHGHGIGSFACVVGAKSASWRSGVCDAIRPYYEFAHIAKFAHTAIHPRCKFTHVTNSLPCFKSSHNGKENCPHSQSCQFGKLIPSSLP